MKGARLTLHFIRLYTVRMKMMTGQTRRSGRKQTLHLASRLALTRFVPLVNLQNKTLQRRMHSDSLDSINGSNRQFVGCRWRSGINVLLLSMKMNSKVESATAGLTFRLLRTLLLWYLCFHPPMKMTDISFFLTFGYPRIVWN